MTRDERLGAPVIPEKVQASLIAAGTWESLVEQHAFDQLDPVTRTALGVIGAWDDLDWDELVASLDRIRHESVPAPPIDVL